MKGGIFQQDNVRPLTRNVTSSTDYCHVTFAFEITKSVSNSARMRYKRNSTLASPSSSDCLTIDIKSGASMEFHTSK
ncbi:hypothetical protein TNCV_2892421 [Trichonephila clavipes]|nr:hypothetical protein TNCV_2892421 [Trichonephila clavipes]